jgi:hypothetical protein
VKKCNGPCGQEKILSEFNKRIRSKDGLQPKCKVCHRLETKHYRQLSTELLNSQSKVWYEQNKPFVLIKMKSYYSQNSSYIKGRVCKYNRDKGQKHRQQRYEVNIQYKLSQVLRSRLYSAVKSGKGGSAVGDLGCSVDRLKIHLQLQFTRRPKDSAQIMNWNNWSHKGWHIDHIEPLHEFDLTDPKQVKIACHYTNLRPLWAEENLRRSYVIAETGNT